MLSHQQSLFLGSFVIATLSGIRVFDPMTFLAKSFIPVFKLNHFLQVFYLQTVCKKKKKKFSLFILENKRSEN